MPHSSPARSSRSTAGEASNSENLHGPRTPGTDPEPSNGVNPATDPRKADFESAKLAKRLRRQVGQAIADFSMIEANDRVMACLSGGKDSYAMLDVLLRLREKSPVPFEVIAVNLDQRHPGFPEHVLPDYLRSR